MTYWCRSLRADSAPGNAMRLSNAGTPQDSGRSQFLRYMALGFLSEGSVFAPIIQRPCFERTMLRHDGRPPLCDNTSIVAFREKDPFPSRSSPEDSTWANY